MSISPADEQQGRPGKQTLLRESNDRLLGVNELGDAEAGELVCECGEEGCRAPVQISLGSFEAIRRDPTLLVVVPEHLPAGHEVVDAGVGYRVVRIVAEAPDPRSRLLALREILERAHEALASRRDERLLDVLVEIDELKLSIANALARLASERTLDS